MSPRSPRAKTTPTIQAIPTTSATISVSAFSVRIEGESSLAASVIASAFAAFAGAASRAIQDFPAPPVCRGCGCTDDRACVTLDGTPCLWVEPDLCSACLFEPLLAVRAGVQVATPVKAPRARLRPRRKKTRAA